MGLATAVKLLVWPLTVWLLVTRRSFDAIVALGLACVSVALVIPFLPLPDYVRMLASLGRAFDQDGYTVFAVLVQAGAAETAARAANLAVGAALLLGTWRYRSFTLAIAASLVLSPIVWLDYFALAAVPLAITRPRLCWVWFVPLATWGLSGAGAGIGGVGDVTASAPRLRRRADGRLPRRALGRFDDVRSHRAWALMDSWEYADHEPHELDLRTRRPPARP